MANSVNTNLRPRKENIDGLTSANSDQYRMGRTRPQEAITRLATLSKDHHDKDSCLKMGRGLASEEDKFPT